MTAYWILMLWWENLLNLIIFRSKIFPVMHFKLSCFDIFYVGKQGDEGIETMVDNQLIIILLSVKVQIFNIYLLIGHQLRSITDLLENAIWFSLYSKSSSQISDNSH